MDIKVNDSTFIVDFEAHQKQEEWYMWREWLLSIYPPRRMIPGYRMADKEGEECSFENWKRQGKPKGVLFVYAIPIKDEASKEFIEKIMRK